MVLGLRPTCYRCLKPQAICLCDRIPSVPNRTEVVVLQHPKERTHPLGTARIVRLGLQRARVEVVHTGLSDRLEMPLGYGSDTALLYPHPQAKDLGSLSPAERPERLVVLDGTWHHAKKLYRDNPWLHSLQHVSLTPSSPSNYRIRKEPKPEYLSTIEAIVESLRVLEPETEGLDGLLSAFTALVDDQMALRAQAKPEPRRLRERHRPYRAIAEELLGDPEGIVVVYGEFSQQTHPEAPVPRALLQWTARRLGTEDVFHHTVQPPRMAPPVAPPGADGSPATPGAWPAPHYLEQLQLTAADLDGAVTIPAFLQAWSEFVRPGDLLAAWKQSSFDLLRHTGAHHPATANQQVLKTAYTNVRNRRSGTVEQTLEREGIPTPAPMAVPGRAAHRLANACALLRWLRDVATERGLSTVR